MACIGNVSWFKASAPKMSWAGIAADSTGQYLAAVSCCNTSGYRGPIYSSSNYGVNWKKTAAPYYNYFRIATSFNSTYYYAVSNNGGGSDGYLILSSDAGQTWSKCTTIENGDSLEFQYVSCDRTGRYVVATTGNTIDGNTGMILISTNYAATWVKVPGLSSQYYWGCATTGQYVGVTVHGGGIYISNNYGQSFDIVSGVPTAQWYSIVISNSGQYYVAVATSAGIYYSSNYGVTFNMSTSAPTSLDWFSVAMSADGQYVAAGVGTNAYAIANSSIYLSTSYGVAWSKASSVPTNKGWQGLAYNSAGTQLAATSDFIYMQDCAPSPSPILAPSLSSSSDSKSATVDVGLIVGIVIPIVVVLILCALFIYRRYINKRRKEHHESELPERLTVSNAILIQ